MDAATINAAIGAVVAAITGVGGVWLGAWRAQRDIARQERSADTEAADHLRDDLMAEVNALRDEARKLRVEVDQLRRSTDACERRALAQAGEIMRLRVALADANIRIPAELPFAMPSGQASAPPVDGQ